MQTISFDSNLVGTGQIFPPSIEDLDWIGYHGTSSYYSPVIDSNGFLLTKPVPAAHLQRLVSIADHYREDASDAQGFIQLQSISFTPTSELALFYVRPESFGGQGLLHVTRLIDILFKKYVERFTAYEAAELAAMRDRMVVIRKVEPVIYAVNLAALKRKTFGRGTLAFHIYEAIPVEALVAKMVIDQAVDYAGIDEKGHKQALRILYSPGNHYIQQIAS
jgi:hypothetical protein